MHLLTLLDKGVVLRYALERKLVHEVDLVRSSQVTILEALDGDREGGREHENLSIGREECNDLLDQGLEFG